MTIQSSPSQKKIILTIRSWLSHHPFLYAFLGGIGVVLFWRGIWLILDTLVLALTTTPPTYGSIFFTNGSWWDGLLSLVLGALILIGIDAFVSSLIGNEIIISGLRSEKRQSEKTDKLILDEASQIQDIRQTLLEVTAQLDALEANMRAKKKRRDSRAKSE